MRVIIQRNVYCLIGDPSAGTYHNFYNTSDLNGKKILDIQLLYRGLKNINIGGTEYSPATDLGNGNTCLINMRQDKSLIYSHYNLPITVTANVNTDFLKDFKKRYRIAGCFDWFNSAIYLSTSIVGPPAPPYYLAFQITYIESES